MPRWRLLLDADGREPALESWTGAHPLMQNVDPAAPASGASPEIDATPRKDGDSAAIARLVAAKLSGCDQHYTMWAYGTRSAKNDVWEAVGCNNCNRHAKVNIIRPHSFDLEVGHWTYAFNLIHSQEPENA